MGLRARVMQGSLYLILREGLGMLISIGAVLLVTRTIGPAQYGIFTAAYSVCAFLQGIGHLGIGLYLVRQEGEQVEKDYHQAFTLMGLIGGAVVAIALLSLPAIQSWVNIKGFAPIFESIVLCSLITILSQAPLAKLERNLEFKRIAWVELLGQLLLFLVALPLATRGFGAWAPTIGWCAQQIQTFILLCCTARYRPSFHWDWARIKPMLSYGFGVSASGWVWYTKTLINPLVVGRLAGETVVGQIALAIRLLDVLSFVKSATYRISIAALAQMQNDASRLRNAISEGMELQILVLGPVLIVASWIAPLIFPPVFGQEWLPALAIFPVMAIPYLGSAAFNLHCSALYVLKRNVEVTVFHAVYVILFGILTLLLVPRLGIFGYAWSEAIAVIAYGITHFYISRFIGSPNYSLSILWWMAFALALFSYQLGWWVVAGLVFVFLLPDTRQRILHYFKTIRELKAS
jgi:O-antigen/teichoic acid export membrane protein